MGNCQAAEVATVVIQHAGGKRVDRLYWSVSAKEVMNSNPSHYVALIVASKTQNGTSVKQLKLLRPDDTLVLGQVYQLITFEDVLKEFDEKKCVKLGKLLKESAGTSNMDPRKNQDNTKSASIESGSDGSGSGSSIRGVDRRQWRPALQSIAELGS